LLMVRDWKSDEDDAVTLLGHPERTTAYTARGRLQYAVYIAVDTGI
jgi:hypothetical protein